MRTLIEVPRSIRQGLDSVTWEQRRKMTAAELILLMGPLHVNHSSYTARDRSLLPMPNLAGRLPVFDVTEPGLWSLVKAFLRWAAR